MWKILISTFSLGGFALAMGVMIFNPEASAGFFTDLFGAEGVARAIADTSIAISDNKVKMMMIMEIANSRNAILLMIALIGGILSFTAPMWGIMEWLKMVKDFGRDGKLDRKEFVTSIVSLVFLTIFSFALVKFGWFLMKVSETGLREML